MPQPIKIGINGFGRIGRIITRLAMSRDDIEIVGINDLSKPEQMLHLFKYDSVHGPFHEDARLDGSTLQIGKRRIQLFAEKDPAALPWGRLEAAIVLDCTGVFTDREKAALHLKGGAKKVIISAPSKDADLTLCMGVNEGSYDPKKHAVISNASCTTNCLAPVAKVLDDQFGIVHGTMLTVHSYTNDQQVLDYTHKDPRRSRAAALSQIPTTTGAAKAVSLVIPHLKGKLDGLAVRVPTPNVSMVDFTSVLKRSVTRDEVNTAFQKASQGPMKGILGFSTEPLVSIDFNGCQNSSTVDAELTHVIEGTLVKVISWYDNETGFSARMLDVSRFLADKGL